MPAFYLLVLLSLTIFGGETAIMFALDHLVVEDPIIRNVADAAALVVIVFPSLYFLMFRSIAKKNDELAAMHRELLAEQEKLEERICDRTKEIATGNAKLKQTIEQLNVRQTEMAQLGEMVNFFQACRDIDEALGVAQPQLQLLFPGLSGALFLMKSSRNILEKVVAWGQSIDMEPCPTPDDCWALRRGKIHEAKGSVGSVPCRHWRSPGAYRHICLPLSAQGEALGTLCLQAPAELDEHADTGDGDRKTFYVAVAEGLALSISNLRLRETLRYQALRDQLTGLFNRRYLLETLERELHRAVARDQYLTVVMLDVDHFKKFNDSFGHAAGDAVLANLGRLLREWNRGEDIVARYGGEEFAVVLPDTPTDLAFERIETLRRAIASARVEHQGQLLPPSTVSAGIAAYPLHAIDRDALIQMADEALYSSKRNGRNRVSIAPRTAGLAQILQKAGGPPLTAGEATTAS